MLEISGNRLFSVKGAVVAVTGGGTGLGFMIANAFAQNGAAKVYIVGRRKEKLEEAAKQHGNIIPIVGDVTSKESLQATTKQILEDVGYVNVVIANSGIPGPNLTALPPNATISEIQSYIMNQEMSDFTRTFEVNTTSVYYTAIAFLTLLDAGNRQGNMPEVRSQIIVTSSINGFNKALGSAAGFAYSTSKAASTHLVKMLSRFLGPHKIRVNATAPGLFASEITAPYADLQKATKEGAYPSTFIPAEKFGDEQDMAGTILYMTSRAGAYMDGNILVIDGGRLGMLPSTY